jgi:hypothetical protein
VHAVEFHGCFLPRRDRVFRLLGKRVLSSHMERRDRNQQKRNRKRKKKKKKANKSTKKRKTDFFLFGF